MRMMATPGVVDEYMRTVDARAQRALDLAVERWRRGATRAVGEGRGAFDLTVVPGIGAATEAAARAGATRFRAESGPREVAP